jgi:hypothetical protein
MYGSDTLVRQMPAAHEKPGSAPGFNFGGLLKERLF